MVKVGAVTRTDPGKIIIIVVSRDAHVGYGSSVTTAQMLLHISPRVAMSAAFNALNTRCDTVRNITVAFKLNIALSIFPVKCRLLTDTTAT